MKKTWIVSWNKYFTSKDTKTSCIFSVHKTKYDGIMEMKKWKRKEDKFRLETRLFESMNGTACIYKVPTCPVHFDEDNIRSYDEIGPEWLELNSYLLE